MAAQAAVKLKAVKAIEQKLLQELLDTELEYKSRQKDLKTLEEKRDGMREYVRVLLKQGLNVQAGGLYAEIKTTMRQNAVKWMEVCGRLCGPEAVEEEKEKAGSTAVERVEVLKRA